MNSLTLTLLIVLVVIVLLVIFSTGDSGRKCSAPVETPFKRQECRAKIPKELNLVSKYIPKAIFASNGTFQHPFTGEICTNYGSFLSKTHNNFQSDFNFGFDDCPKCRFEEDYTDLVESNLQTAVSDGLIKYGFATAKTKKQMSLFLAGEGKPGKPFKKTDFFRLASESKVVGTVGFLKLVDQGVLTGFEPLSTFFPAFANTKVIQQFDPTVILAPIIIPAGSLSFNNGGDLTEMTVDYTGGGLAVGDWVSIEYGHVGLNGLLPVGVSSPPSVNGVPGYTVYNIHQITAINAGVSFNVILPTSSAGTGSGFGAIIIIQKVDAETKRSISISLGSFTPIRTFLTTAYYKEVALRSPILVHHVLTYTYGLIYYISALLHATFGFAENIPLRNIQAGILAEKNIIAGRSTNLNPSVTNIQQWVNLVATVPLLFQPGEKWCYGPGLSILGGIIEVVKGVPLAQYMKDEVFTPLGMANTGFHISPSDTAKISRFATVYYNFGPPSGLQPVTAFAAAPFLFPSSLINEAESSWYNGTQITLIDSAMYSTAEDYLKFLSIFLHNGKGSNGRRILSKAMILNMSRNHVGQNNVSNLLDFGDISLTVNTPPINWAKWGLGVAVTTGANLYVARGMSLNSISKRSIAWTGAFGTSWTADITGGLVTHVGGNTIGAGNIFELATYQAKLINLYHAAFPCTKANDENITGEFDYL